MIWRSWWRSLFLVGAVTGVGVGMTTPAGAPPIAMGIEPGLWHVQFDDGRSQSLCLHDVQPLIQLAHPGIICSRLPIETGPRLATIHYGCGSAGWGRTSLRQSFLGKIRIESQGIATNAPFAFTAEARRAGACPAKPGVRP